MKCHNCRKPLVDGVCSNRRCYAHVLDPAAVLGMKRPLDPDAATIRVFENYLQVESAGITTRFWEVR